MLAKTPVAFEFARSEELVGRGTMRKLRLLALESWQIDWCVGWQPRFQVEEFAILFRLGGTFFMITTTEPSERTAVGDLETMSGPYSNSASKPCNPT